MKFRVIVAPLLALALLTACSSDSKKEATADKPNSKVKPCELITKAEAEAAYGGSLQDGTSAPEPSVACIFGSTGTKNIADNVQVQVMSMVVWEGTKKTIGENKNGFTIEAVSGIGEDAFIQTYKGESEISRSIILGFKKNNAAIYISVKKADLTDEQTKEVEKTLAKKAADRVG